MKIDAMMAEIRETHPDFCELGNKIRGYILYSDSGRRSILGRGLQKYEAVYSALKAVRKARPRPMTVAQAKAAVKARYPKARVARDHFRKTPLIFDDERLRILGEAPTEGQAWKAAAAAIQKEGS